jgi:hypothetical protein
MALDAYVMPLQRVKVGDFRSPIEAAIGIRPKIVTPEGILQLPKSVNWLQRWRAKQEVKAIRKAVEAANGIQIRWMDRGEVVYAEQAHGLDALRAFAKWLDCREQFPRFSVMPESDYHEHPIWSVMVPRVSCPHLVTHDCFNGFYLPCEFERVVPVETNMILGKLSATRPVGSSLRLLRELDFLQKVLKVPSGYQQVENDRLHPVKAAYIQLRTIAELSVKHRLPIIFWG